MEQIATFGGGCFWGVEENFRVLPGITETAVGFMGGPNPITYEESHTDTTGHAEVVHLSFDPEKISYEELLKVFFDNHDPTQVNRQGPDIGTQYRSVIFYHDNIQKESAEKFKKELQDSEKYGASTIATEIAPAKEFYIADEDHQKYLFKRGVKTCAELH
jgi:peptide-methionine (S)-S-oxide reductase